jgi:hypothetical protein
MKALEDEEEKEPESPVKKAQPTDEQKAESKMTPETFIQPNTEETVPVKVEAAPAKPVQNKEQAMKIIK